MNIALLSGIIGALIVLPLAAEYVVIPDIPEQTPQEHYDINSYFTIQMAHARLNPADSTTYYWGAGYAAPLTSDQGFTIDAPCHFHVTAVYINGVVGVIGSNEDASIYIRINNNDNLITNRAEFNTATFGWAKTDFNVSVGAGNDIVLKMVCPNYATNPQNIYGNAITLCKMDAEQTTIEE